MVRKAYILFPNEANHSGGFAPHSLNPSPYATASGNTHMHTHITGEVGPVMSDANTHTDTGQHSFEVCTEPNSQADNNLCKQDYSHDST